MSSSDHLITTLDLEKHPEGGYYRRIYESSMSSEFWPDKKQRLISTAIMYLLQNTDYSAFHKIRSDEIWFLGESNTDIRLIELRASGAVETIINKQNPTYCVEAGNWFAAELLDPSEESYALCYCSVAPGFDFEDFTMASKEDLLGQFPENENYISRLCKK